MRLSTPHWWRHRGWQALCLTPIADVVGLLAGFRRSTIQPRTASIPVICIGNVVAGGTGKTPIALAVARLLAMQGHTPHIISRGYGGTLKGPIAVDLERHTSVDTGDEALLLRQSFPTWVARDRLAGVEAAANAGATIAVLDDGLQHHRLAKTATLMVVDGGYGFGNGLLIPAGPLREPLEDGLARAQGVVVLGDDTTGAMARIQTLAPAVPIFRAALAPLHATRWLGKRVVAFAGIGRPEKFFTTLRLIGADVVASRAFPDHYPYSPQDVTALQTLADQHKAPLITTAKDYIRLSVDVRQSVNVLEVEALFADNETFCNWLGEHVQPHHVPPYGEGNHA